MSLPIPSSTELPSGRLYFEDFELRLDTCELARNGSPVKLQRQPARLLGLLASRSGEVVTREEIRRALWGEDAFLEVESAINFAIRQIRRALGDSATEPRFVETLPRLGYRFLPAVRQAGDGGPPTPPPVHREAPLWRVSPVWAAGLVLLAVLALGIGGIGDIGGMGDIGGRGGRGGSTAGPRGGRTALRVTRPISRQAYEVYLEGLHLAGSPNTRARGTALLERATRLAPGFAPAWSALAFARFDFQRRPAAEYADGVERAARQALHLEPGNAEAHRALGELALYGRFDLAGAQAELLRALHADPGSAEAHRSYANSLASRGHLGEAIAEAERARAIDPLSEAVRSDLVWFHYLARGYDEAIHQGALAARIDPVLRPGRFYWLLSEMLKADDSAPALAQGQDFAAWMTTAWHLSPPPRFARLHDFWVWRLARLEELRRQVGVSPGILALNLLASGDHERALGLFDEACRQHFGWMLPFLPYDPLADSLRGDPRFARILRCAGHGGLGA